MTGFFKKAIGERDKYVRKAGFSWSSILRIMYINTPIMRIQIRCPVKGTF